MMQISHSPVTVHRVWILFLLLLVARISLLDPLRIMLQSEHLQNLPRMHIICTRYRL